MTDRTMALMNPSYYSRKVRSWRCLFVVALIALLPLRSTLLTAQEDSQRTAANEQGKVTRDTEQTVTGGEPVDSQSDSEVGDSDQWENLFDGKSLEGWTKTNFGGEGEVIVEDGVIKMAVGVTLTGITSDRKDLPKSNYEVEYEARRTEGLDFFSALTFQFNDSFCTFLPGGWTGTVTGLSNIDDEDASENDTNSFVDYNDNQWYKFRVAVRKDSIRCWIDDKKVIDRKITDEKIAIRPEVLPTAPLGISAWQSVAEIRSIRMRKLLDAEAGESEPSKTPKSTKTTVDSGETGHPAE